MDLTHVACRSQRGHEIPVFQISLKVDDSVVDEQVIGVLSSFPKGCSWIVCTRHAAATVDGNRIEEGEGRFTINDREAIIAAGV